MQDVSRVALLKSLVREIDVDSILVTTMPNTAFYLRYFKYGRKLSAIVVDEQEVICIVPEAERDLIPTQGVDVGTHTYSTSAEPSNGYNSLASKINDHISGTLGVEGGACQSTGTEADTTPYALLDALEADNMKNISNELIAQRRSHYDNQRMDRALSLASKGLQAVKRSLEPGVSEAELRAAALESIEGSTVRPLDDFFSIFLSGDETAKVGHPLGSTTDRLLRAGDTVLVELLPRLAFYRGTVTRTFTVGEPTEQQRAFNQAVVSALENAKDVVRPGVPASSVYDCITTSLSSRGLEQFFSHHGGHGVGMDVHEPPILLPGSQKKIRQGDVIAIEPGIYSEEFGGYRVEDVIRVTESGYDTLTDIAYTL